MELIFTFEDRMLEDIKNILGQCRTDEEKMNFIKQHLRIAYHKGIDDVGEELKKCEKNRIFYENKLKKIVDSITD